MSEPPPVWGTREAIFTQFLLDLEDAADPNAVVRRYAAEYPEWSSAFQEHAAIARLAVRQADAEEPRPEGLPDFHILGEVARGGMGVIYKAEQLSTRRQVALKVIRPDRVSPVNRQRFFRERETLARLHQTHIVPIFTGGEREPWSYFAMPFIDGAGLHHLVRDAYRRQTSQPGCDTPTLAELAKQLRKPHAEEMASASVATVAPAPTGSLLGPAENPRVKLTTAYFRSVAQVMADAAEALQHAHDLTPPTVHRDLKPSNIMVDVGGQCWIIDWGLAAAIPGKASAENGERAADPNRTLEFASGVLGTPPYMAPEQFDGGADVRSDVWGLGVTLYELLTLRKAFNGPTSEAIKDKVQTAEPMEPRRLVDNVPRDLEAICLKALHKPIHERYQTAREFADDLRRWLRFEPTTARPARTLRRTYLWTRRNKGWAVAIAALTVLALIEGTRLFKSAKDAQDAERAAEAKAKTAQRVADAELELLERRLQFTNRVTKRDANWSTDAWKKIDQLLGASDKDKLRDIAAAYLGPLDASIVKTFNYANKSGVSVVAFAPDGRLYFAEPNAKVHVWNKQTDETQNYELPGQPGPFAFPKNGTVLQLRPFPKEPFVELWDVVKPRRLLHLTIKGQEGSEVIDAVITPDGARIAVAAGGPSGKGSITLFDGTSGKELQQLAHRATALAISPDGKLLAAGNEAGAITWWDLARGKEIGKLPAGHTPIRSLAFGHDTKIRPPGSAASEWLLASGDSAGLITIWDLTDRVPRSFCRGSRYDVFALAFHPGRTMLASTGRSFAKLWDVATGRLLLNIEVGWSSGLAFSPDGTLLAVPQLPIFAGGRMDVWRLENGRGLQTLYGLTAPISKVYFSRDSRLIAALSNDWNLAVWEAKSGNLLHFFEVPLGFSADNGAVVFDADGRRLAWAADTNARLWDLTNGQLLQKWDLRPGMVDYLAFHPTGKLLLFRVERKDGPGTPLVCRIRNLLAKEPQQLVAEIPDFNGDVYDAAAAPDGSFFIVEGKGGPSGQDRAIKAFDGTTGREKWSISSKRKPGFSLLVLDPSGKHLVLMLHEDRDQPKQLIEAATGRLLDSFEIDHLTSLADNHYSAASALPNGPKGFSLFSLKDHKRLVTLGLDNENTSIVSPFAPDGIHVAWGNADGTVTVCDIPAVQQRLAGVGLGWE